MTEARPEARPDPRLPLADRRVLVTGGASGIGRAIVIELARQGAAVAVADLQAPTGVIEEVRAAGGVAFGLRADVSQPQAVEEMVSGAIAALGGLDGMVNNAGI
jgi:NAD(P)-dependent dehydrogenase (short-subunit alcohol dehydrogenase family)